jgi:hypothetical protein
MTIGSIILGLALAVLVGLFIARPLLKTDARSKSKLTPYQALLAQKEAILAQISSLDFDYDTGKLTDDDYHRTREEFMVAAEDIFRQLDEFEQRGEVVEPATGLDSDIEAAIARRRTQTTPVAPATGPTQPPTSNGKSKYCPECGKPTDPNDKFCANCGHKQSYPQHA